MYGLLQCIMVNLSTKRVVVWVFEVFNWFIGVLSGYDSALSSIDTVSSRIFHNKCSNRLISPN